MDIIASVFFSFLTFVSSVLNIPKAKQGTTQSTKHIQNAKQGITPISTRMPDTLERITQSQTSTPVVSKPDATSATTTPTNIFMKIKDEYVQVVTMRRGETIRLKTIRPMKGTEIVSVELPASGSPAGVFLTQDQAVTERNIFIHTQDSVVIGSYEWRQSFKTISSSGVGPGDLSFAVLLHVLP